MTLLVTSSGPVNVISAVITEPKEGAWTARVVLDSDDPVTGPVVFQEGLTTWAGAQKRGAQEHGRTVALLVGGTGGLSTAVGVRNYKAPRISQLLLDLMLDTKEVISPDISSTILFSQVERWSRRSGPGGLSLKQIADETSADTWRIRRDGLVWLGSEGYPVVPPTFSFVEISRDPGEDSVTIAPDDNQILVAVGDNFLGRNVAGVVTHISLNSLRQVISWESGDGSTKDRVLGPMRTVVEAFVGRSIDYARWYPCKVKAQNADGTLDLTPDDERIRGNGFQSIQISHGLPGVTFTVPTGGRVNLYFQNGDPKQPRAALWESSGVTEIVVDGGSQAVMRGTTFVSSLDTFVDALSVYIQIPAPTGPDTVTWVAAVAAFKLALTTSTTSVLKVS